MKERTRKIINQSSGFSSLIKKQVCVIKDGIVCTVSFPNRFRRVLAKIAVGHSCYANDVLLDLDKAEVGFDFLPNLKNEEIEAFNDCPEVTIMPELGSRSIGSHVALFGSDPTPYYLWDVIQEGRYRYLAFVDANGNDSVRIVVDEFLYAVVNFH